MSKPLSDKNKKRLKDISAFLHEFRINSGYTLNEATEDIMHKNTLLRIEHGHPFSILQLFALADLYEISLSEIFYGID